MRRSALSARRAPARGRGQALRGRVRRQLVRIQAEAFEGVGEAAPGMGPARQVHQPLVAHRRQTAAVAVGVQRAGEPCEQAFGHVARAGRVILEQHDGRVGAGTHLRPELGLRLSALAGLFEHLHGGLVHQQVGAVEQFIAQQVEERDHECAGAHHPRGQRGAREVHADALELLVLAIQRQGIGAVRRWPSQCGQRYLPRTWRSTRTWAGMMSSCSLTTSPKRSSSTPWCGQVRSWSGNGCSTSMRGRASGNGARFGVARRWAATSVPGAVSGSSVALASASLNNPSCPSGSFSKPAPECLYRGTARSAGQAAGAPALAGARFSHRARRVRIRSDAPARAARRRRGAGLGRGATPGRGPGACS